MWVQTTGSVYFKTGNKPHRLTCLSMMGSGFRAFSQLGTGLFLPAVVSREKSDFEPHLELKHTVYTSFVSILTNVRLLSYKFKKKIVFVAFAK